MESNSVEIQSHAVERKRNQSREGMKNLRFPNALIPLLRFFLRSFRSILREIHRRDSSREIEPRVTANATSTQRRPRARARAIIGKEREKEREGEGERERRRKKKKKKRAKMKKSR